MENYDVIGTNCRYFGERDNEPDVPLGDISNFDFRRTNPVINSSCLIKKSLCFWNPNTNAEDYELWLRLWKNKCKFYNVPEIQVLHRIHQSSAFNANDKNNRDAVKLGKYY
jgi:hypothetical protein